MNGNSFNSRREKLLSALSVASMILIFALLLLAFIFAMYKLGVIELPEPVERLLGKGGKDTITVLPNDDGRIYEALEEGRSGPGYGVVEYDISAADAYDALRNTVPMNSYTARFTVTLSEGGKEMVRNVYVWRDAAKYRIEIYEKSALRHIAVCDGENVKVSDCGANGKELSGFIYPASDNISFESQAMIPTISDVFENSYVTDAEISLLRTEQENVYLVKYRNSAAQSEEKLYVSLEYGLVLRAESRDAGGVFYTLKTDMLTPGILPGRYAGNELFALGESG